LTKHFELNSFNVFKLYFDSFKGLKKEIWCLALITFINRAGTMVIPFLSLYLTKSLNFTLNDVGWIMSAFGLGSVVGAWIGGKLCARFGFYPVMLWSLILSGCMFIGLQFISSFWYLCLGVFILMLIADTFRPASYVAVDTYSENKDKTRSISLLRLAINLGFSFGPALGGLIIAKISYKGLFWADGITCVLAGLFIVLLLNKKESVNQLNLEKKPNLLSPYRDWNYLLFIFIVFLVGFTFLQYFSTIPLYYNKVHHLTEQQIGWLYAFNGGLIFLIEMPIVKTLEQKNRSIYSILKFSSILLALSFLLLNWVSWSGILIIGMLFMTVGEVYNFPFLNSYALKSAKKGNLGEYMALFTMAFSLSHIFGHKMGMVLVDKFGFTITWYIMGAILVFAYLLFQVLQKRDFINNLK
jgi:predicted MFS family arabinose efflux permease